MPACMTIAELHDYELSKQELDQVASVQQGICPAWFLDIACCKFVVFWYIWSGLDAVILESWVSCSRSSSSAELRRLWQHQISLTNKYVGKQFSLLSQEDLNAKWWFMQAVGS